MARRLPEISVVAYTLSRPDLPLIFQTFKRSLTFLCLCILFCIPTSQDPNILNLYHCTTQIRFFPSLKNRYFGRNVDHMYVGFNTSRPDCVLEVPGVSRSFLFNLRTPTKWNTGTPLGLGGTSIKLLYKIDAAKWIYTF